MQKLKWYSIGKLWASKLFSGPICAISLFLLRTLFRDIEIRWNRPPLLQYPLSFSISFAAVCIHLSLSLLRPWFLFFSRLPLHLSEEQLQSRLALFFLLHADCEIGMMRVLLGNPPTEGRKREERESFLENLIMRFLSLCAFATKRFAFLQCLSYEFSWNVKCQYEQHAIIVFPSWLG